MVDDGENLFPLCSEKASSSGSTNMANTEVAEYLIEAFFDYNPRQYIIIDGLDECETSEIHEIARFFKDRISKCDNEIRQGRLRVQFMSQPMPELAKDEVMPEDDACVELKPTDNADDIRAYVKKRISNFSEKRATSSGFNLSEDDIWQIEGIICRRSEGLLPPKGRTRGTLNCNDID
jgi:hypothetical protein